MKYFVIYYICKENGDCNIKSITEYDSLNKARYALEESVKQFRENEKERYVLHDCGTIDKWHIDFRGGYNEFNTWEIATI